MTQPARPILTLSIPALLLLLLPVWAAPLSAQVTPAAGYTPPDDTPSYKIGATIFADYTYTDEPTSIDADGNTIHPQGFDVTRAYINVTGNINHLIGFRVTPDIVRAATKNGVGDEVSNALDGSLTFRLKYAFGQFNLDNAWSKGSWVRFGVQQTPYIDWDEQRYRYRFQGQTFVETEGYLTSSDFGASAHYNFPGNYGDVHAGYYNGDTYKKAEVNDQEAFQIRATLRPAPMVRGLQGLLVSVFYDADHYTRSDPRTRLLGSVIYEHKRVNAGFEYLDAKDQTSDTTAEVKAKGYSIWATPRLGKGWELLLRYDHLTPNKDQDGTKNRQIGGVAYWFKTQSSSLQTALLADYTRVTYDQIDSPDEKRYALHTLFNF
jgi:hypothetical protein